MIGAFKCCGTGARMLKNAPSGVSSSLETSTFGKCGFRDYNNKSLNWSQKRFLRGQSPSSNGSPPGMENANARFVIKEVESQRKPIPIMISENLVVSLAMEKELRKHSRSLRDYQAKLLKSMNSETKKDLDLIIEISKVITEEGSPVVRLKNRKDETYLKEWIGVQKELRVVKRDRVEDYRRRLQIASQQALEEMEANLQKATSLDELDQAIEGALCSEVKREYNQKSWHDN